MELKNIAIGGLTIILLISLGFNIAPDATHFCRELEISRKCDHLSSTERTCYPYDFTTKGKKFCSSGWELLISEEQAINKVHQGRQWCCIPGSKICEEGACKNQNNGG